jgi:hypothetical protein
MKFTFIFLLFSFITIQISAQKILVDDNYMLDHKDKTCFTLSASGKTAPIYISSSDYPGVIRAANDLVCDLEKVTGTKTQLSKDALPKTDNIVIIGTLGKNTLLDRLVKEKKIHVEDISGKWENLLIQVVENPLPGVKQALVIAGSDKRGTIYGIYDLSEKIGISPWYYWADVAPEKKTALYIKAGRYTQSPSVKYRGIFLNDENPDLTRWVAEKFGNVKPGTNPPMPNGVANYNHQFYAKVFELILRLKGNYLWPAMWNNAFNEDDPENPRLADEYGIVMGTSHQEPMLRAQKEWDRRYQRTIGSWNYTKYPDTLQRFWRKGIQRNKNYESILTIGLRGANDTEMAPGGPEANKTLLENIVDVERKIIAQEINPDVTKVPQLWCLYKEVQDYYNAGMRVPDDVTLLWAEDNWGNVRRLPTPEERKRSGGAGIYYHFDYHGGPRSYQWINSNPLPKIWDQMSLAKQYGADRIWIVNVGHLKGYELPIEYFLKLGWNSEKLTNSNINAFTTQWAEREFGNTYAKEIAGIVSAYGKFNGRRKPELLDASTYSLTNYKESETVVNDFNAIAAKAEELYKKMAPEKRDAFYQLVLFPSKAGALVNELYRAAATNMLYAKQGRAATNDYADKTRQLFSADTSLMGYYNRVYANGRWNHFMDQSHLGYRTWADPPFNNMSAIKLQNSEPGDSAVMGVAIEGSESVWPGTKETAQLPTFVSLSAPNLTEKHIDIFNKGKVPFKYTIKGTKPWIVISPQNNDLIQKEKQLSVSIDWSKAPAGFSIDTITISGTQKQVKVIVKTYNDQKLRKDNLLGFAEEDGYVSMEAEHFMSNTNAGNLKWVKIEDYGHTLSGMRATAPANAPAATPGKDAPCLEYRMESFDIGAVNVKTYCSPVLNFMPGRAIQYAVSFDNETPQIVTLIPGNYNAKNGNRDWEKAVSDNYRIGISKHSLSTKGSHVLKIWMVDPGVVLQKIVVDFGSVKPSYLGPPESVFNNHEKTIYSK